MKTITLNRKRKTWAFSFALFSFLFALFSCDHGQLGGADRTDTYYPTDAQFEERLQFLCGVWYSHNPYSNDKMDGYRIREWSTFTDADKTRAQTLFSGISFNAGNPKTYSTQDYPQNGDYVVLFDDNPSDTPWGYGYMGLVKAINIFNDNIKRGAVIIEYFDKADPLWLSDQGLTRGEKPFFGIYFKEINSNTIQMAHPVDLYALLNTSNPYYTEQGTLDEAVKKFGVENEAEFIDWSVVSPQSRE
jgi:hypothetical protein